MTTPSRDGLSCLTRGLIAAGIALAGAGAAAFAQTQPELQLFVGPASKALGLRDCSLVRLDVSKEPEQPQVVHVPVGGAMFTFNLMPHSMRGPNYKALEQRADGQVYEVKPGKETTVRGFVSGQPRSVIAGGLMPDGLYAMALFEDGSRYWIEPVGGRVEGAPEDLYAVYTHDESIPGPWRCGNADLPAPPPADGQPPIGNRGATLRTAQISTDADFEFFAFYGGTARANARIAVVLNIMNVQYERETDITHVLATQLVRAAEPDPYTSTSSANLLDTFRADWNANRPGSRGDVAQLFTGKEVDGNTIGLAFVGVVCTADAYGIVQSDYNGNLMSATDLSAHEAGHNWSATHCTCSGVGTTVSTMNPNITSINRFTFSNDVNNVNQIVNHRNSRACLTSGTGGTDPRNDLCASATPILGPCFIGWTNFGAVTDGPAACGAFGSDIWYLYTAPCDGTLTVNTCGSNHDTTLAIYSGACGSLTELACNDDFAACGGTGRQSQVSVAVTRGIAYRIRLGGFNSAVGDGLLAINQTACPAPANDVCGAATTIGQGAFPFSTIGSGSEGPIELTLCNNASDAQLRSDIWFRYVAPCTGVVRVGTCGANFDSKLAIYTSCPTGINSAIACNDDGGPACGGTASSVDFNSTAGVAYLIRLGGFNSQVGAGTLTVSSLSCPPPANDGCASPTIVGIGDFAGNNAGAGTDGIAACVGSGRDVWYQFTAPFPARLRVTTCGTHDAAGVDTGFDTVLSVHSGCPGSTGNTLVCDDDFPFSATSPNACAAADTGVRRDSAVALDLTAGQTVLIRVAAFGGTLGGPFQLHLSWAGIPNDTCATAQLVGTSAFSLDTTPAQNEGDPSAGSCNSISAVGIDNSAWYRFVPSGTGNATGTIDPTSYDGLAIFYSGACGSLTEIACFDEPEPMNFSVPVMAGQTYYLAIGDWGTGDGGGSTNVSLILPVGGGSGACCCGSSCTITSAAACPTGFVGSGTVCNPPGNNTAPCCRADFNRSGSISVQDIFDFLAAYFASNPCADTNASGATSVQDIFDFLAAYFAGGC